MALVDECKKQNIPFAGHLPEFILLKEAADAGQQSIEHLTGLYYTFYHSCPPEEVIKALPAEIAAGSPFVPLMQQGVQLCDEKEEE